MKLYTAEDTASLWAISVQMVRRYCREGKVPGAVQTEQGWMIPEGTPKPGAQTVRETPPTPLVKKILYYYATGRHHSVILGLTIPDFLDLLKIDESKEYRIFINEYFCRVMDGTTDRLISFFGHNAIKRINLSVDLSSVDIQKICPACGSPMKFKEGKYGEFLGCSRYPNCKQSAKLPIIGSSKNP